MKLFTPAEANAILPSIIPKLELIRSLYARVEGLRDAARAAASASDFGGGMEGGTTYVNTLYKIGKLTTDLYELGIEIKDPSRGLIDFPSMRGDRVVLLCWQLGEDEEIGWWHETDGGFAGRQPL
ncbi:MAG: DUF2203 domain-containing protein [Chloracidobacterium sp.]|nr:DUF2203 domain-containing protein [Chloracidobacterium sp.]